MHFNLPVVNRTTFLPNHILWLLLVSLSGLLQAAGWVPEWRFDRGLIDSGHYWLLFSGHIVHLNWSHWALNMGGLAVVAFFFSPYGNIRQWLLVVFVSASFVGLGLYWLNPELVTYVGLSGVLHGLFIYGAIHERQRYPASGIALLVLLIGKLIWEFFNGALPGSEDLTAGHVITDAHLYGAIGGAVAAGLLWIQALRWPHEIIFKIRKIKEKSANKRK